VQFNRIRITGFKSFVDPTELVIDEGLTGIVGPNGCGKSNLVEALRWAMGETSAKQMRRHRRTPGAEPRRGHPVDGQFGPARAGPVQRHR
jgi:chromosome segregation ATPase